MKYSILLPYYRRVTQFASTLESFKHHYSHRDDYEVVVVADIKTPQGELDWLSNQPVRLFKAEQKDGSLGNPAPHFNQAAREAKGEYLVISNPEVFHASDILGGLDGQVGEKYVLCACQSVYDTKLTIGQKPKAHRWYQHSVHDPRDLHFCTVLRKDLFLKVGGFDEAYAAGISFDDDDFRETVKAAGIEFSRRDDLLTYHLHHERTHQRVQGYRQKLMRNTEIYRSKWGG